MSNTDQPTGSRSTADQLLFELGYDIVKTALESESRPWTLQILPVWPSTAVDQRTPGVVDAKQRFRLVRPGGDGTSETVSHPYPLGIPAYFRPLEANAEAASRQADVENWSWNETMKILGSSGEYEVLKGISATRDHFYNQIARQDTTNIHIVGPGCPDLKDFPGDFAKHVSTVCLYPTYFDSVDYSPMLQDLPALKWLVLGGLQLEFSLGPKAFYSRSDQGIPRLPFTTFNGFNVAMYEAGLQAGAPQAFKDILAIVTPYMGVSAFTKFAGEAYVVRQFELTDTEIRGSNQGALSLVVGSRIPQEAGAEPDVFIVYAVKYNNYSSKLDRPTDATRGAYAKTIPRFSEAFMVQMVKNFLWGRVIGKSDSDALDWCRYNNMFVNQEKQMANRYFFSGIEPVETAWTSQDVQLARTDPLRSRFEACMRFRDVTYDTAPDWCLWLWNDWIARSPVYDLQLENGVSTWGKRVWYIARFWPASWDVIR